MANKIHIVEGDRFTSSVERTRFDSEDRLQNMLAECPDLLAGDQMLGQDLRFVLIKRELNIYSTSPERSIWRLDHLFIDQYGTPTLVEVKRSGDARIRREVVGQVLEYAAHVRESLPPGKMRELFRNTCGSDAKAEAQMEELLGVDDNAPDDIPRSLTARIDDFWSTAERALSEHRIRLIFLADELPHNLIRVIEFLNNELEKIEVVGVDVQLYKADQFHILVPRVVGLSTQVLDKRRRANPDRIDRDEESFLAELTTICGDSTTAAVQKIMKWCSENEVVIGFTTTKRGSFVPEFRLGADMVWPFAINVGGRVKLQLDHLANRGGGFKHLPAREELLRRLNAFLHEKIDLNRASAQPSFALSELTSDAALHGFLQTMAWVKQEMSRS